MAPTTFAFLLLPLFTQGVRIEQDVKYAANLQSDHPSDIAKFAKDHPPPTTFLLGFPKCGTTSMFYTLTTSGHFCGGDLYPGEEHFRIKETEYFVKNDLKSLLDGLPDYLKRFDHCKASGKLGLDATTHYCSKRDTPRLIHKIYKTMEIDVSKLRFLIMLRDPADRSLSWYKHSKRNKFSEQVQEVEYASLALSEMELWETCEKKYNHTSNFDAFLKCYDVMNAKASGKIYNTCSYDFSSMCAVPGIYAPAIENWIKTFDPSQILVATLNQYSEHFEELKLAIGRFVGVNMGHASSQFKNLAPSHKNNQYSISQHPILDNYYARYNLRLAELADKYPQVFFQHSYLGNDPNATSEFMDSLLNENSRAQFYAERSNRKTD